MSEKFHY